MNNDYIIIIPNNRNIFNDGRNIIQKIILGLIFLSFLIFLLIGLLYSSKYISTENFIFYQDSQQCYLISFILFNLFITCLFAFIRAEYCCNEDRYI